MKFIPIIILLIIVFIPKQLDAKSYQISLFYDKNSNEIRLDRFVSEPVQLVDTEDNIPFSVREDLPIDNNFKVILEAYQYTFPQTLVYPYKEGAFFINVDYFPHVKEIKIKSNTSNTLSIDVSDKSTCNQNNICEYEKGEDANTCIADCIGDNVQFSEETIRTLQSQNGVIRNEEGVVLLSTNAPAPTTPTDPETNSNGSNILLLIGGILFLVAGVGVFIWKLRRR
jgi:LPXTG-motif cell wall-anchored protein